MVYNTLEKTGWKVAAAIDKKIAYKEVDAAFRSLLILSVIFIAISLAVIIFLLFILFKPKPLRTNDKRFSSWRG